MGYAIYPDGSLLLGGLASLPEREAIEPAWIGR